MSHHWTRLSAVVALAAVAASAALLAVTHVPTDEGSLSTITPVTINEGAGDQFDPHVDGDIVSYTDGDHVRYFSFATSADAQVPTPMDAIDQLSDVSNGKIVFSRFNLVSGQQSILVFDVAAGNTVEIDPQATSLRTNASVGSDTVAFIDFGLSPNGEVVIAETGVPAVRVTNDSRFDQAPSVAPLGNLVVYESCVESPGNCDVRQAARVGSSWVVTNLTDNAEPDANPDTDGTVIVYDARRSGERDIYWQPVGGGDEQRLELPGVQRDPSVSGGLVLFESAAVGETAANLYVYHIATNRLFQITSTPGLDENLNDVSALPNGQFHIVWSSGADQHRDMFGATITLPDNDAPEVVCSPAAADGTWHADNVSFACTATDAGSGLADPGQASFSVATEVAAGDEHPNAFAPPTAVQVCDVAGNCATAQIGGNMIDRRAPTVMVTTPSSGASYVQGQSVISSYGCVDNGSGLSSCAGPVVSGQPIVTSTPGAQTFSVTATDTVGNTAVVNIPYTVVPAATIAGLIQQVNALTLSPLAKRVLIAALNLAQHGVNQGRLTLARAALQSFVFEVRVLMLLGAIDPATGNSLVSQAQAIAAAL